MPFFPSITSAMRSMRCRQFFVSFRISERRIAVLYASSTMSFIVGESSSSKRSSSLALITLSEDRSGFGCDITHRVMSFDQQAAFGKPVEPRHECELSSARGRLYLPQSHDLEVVDHLRRDFVNGLGEVPT